MGRDPLTVGLPSYIDHLLTNDEATVDVHRQGHQAGLRAVTVTQAS